LLKAGCFCMNYRVKRKPLFLLLLFIALFLFLTLAGCSGEGASSEEGKSSDGTVELNVMVMLETQGDATELTVWNEIVQAYRAAHPTTKINLQPQFFPGVEQHRAWVTTQLIGGTAPDVFTTRYIWDQEDLKKQLMTDLTPFYSKKTAYSGDQTWEQTYPKPVLAQLIGEDKTYASVPTYVNSVRVLYNKDLFAKAGIQEVPKTWAEFIAAQKKLAELKVAPFAFPNSKPGDYNYSWSTRILTEELIAGSYGELDVNGNGLIEVNEFVKAVDEGKIDIEKPPYRDVFPLMKEWSAQWAKGANGLDFDTSTDMFLRGETAMVMRTAGQSKVIYESTARKFEAGAFPLPYVTKETHPGASGKLMEIGGVPAGNLAIPKSIAPKKLEAAVDFLAYTTSPKVQGLLAEKLYRTPAIQNADLPDKLKGFSFVGEPMKLNIYAGEVDKNVTETNQKLGQLYLEGSISLDKYVADLKKVMVDGVKQKMKANNWTPDNNYGITK
jgi:raffinose/stachyose/melibiose transport system substrate-binding protein